MQRCGHTEDDSSESKSALIEEKICALIQYSQTMLKPIVHRFISFDLESTWTLNSFIVKYDFVEVDLIMKICRSH